MNKKSRILEVCFNLFAKNGFAGTSIAEIAKEAQVTKSLIYHYFDSKEVLWIETKKYISSQVNIHSNYEEMSFANLREFLETVIWDRYKLYSLSTNMSRMLQWQHLEENKYIGSEYNYSPSKWKNAIIKLQQENKIKHYSPEFIIIMIANAVSGAFLSSYHKFLKNKNDELFYIEMVINSMERALEF